MYAASRDMPVRSSICYFILQVFASIYLLVYARLFIHNILLVMMKSNDYISIYYYNANSIQGLEKLTAFNNSFSGNAYQVISVTETWLHEDIHDEEILPYCDYSVFRRDRGSVTSKKESGGGVMTAVHESLPAVR